MAGIIRVAHCVTWNLREELMCLSTELLLLLHICFAGAATVSRTRRICSSCSSSSCPTRWCATPSGRWEAAMTSSLGNQPSLVHVWLCQSTAYWESENSIDGENLAVPCFSCRLCVTHRSGADEVHPFYLKKNLLLFIKSRIPHVYVHNGARWLSASLKALLWYFPTLSIRSSFTSKQ